MSNAANPAGSDAGSHFTVEDSGSTTDAADLVHDDETVASSQAGTIGTTTAGSHPTSASGPGSHDEDPVEAADEVVRSTDRVPAEAEQQESVAADPAPTAAAERTDETATTEPQQPTARQEDAAPKETSIQQAEQVEPAASTPEHAPTPHAGHGGLSALADADLGHVFDQTNGVIERADGDSDGSAESDVSSEAERFEDNPVIADAGVHGDGEVPESRRTGD